MSDLYQAIIIEAAADPQNKGELSEFDAQAHHQNASCGDDLKVQIKLSTDQAHVAAVAWQGNGCAISQAAMSVLSEKMQGMQLNEITQLQQSSLESLLGIEKISPGRIKCLMLGLNAVKRALADVEKS